jgi:hypothetical protein
MIAMATSPFLPRRRILRSVGLAALTVAIGGLTACGNASANPVAMVVHRNPGCGCCEQWSRQMRASGRFTVTTVDDPNVADFKRAHRVPPELASCHTALVGGYVVEGHVPRGDIERLLSERPPGIIGLAVGGMPMGSPGMEQPGMGRDAFDVVAFGADANRAIFAHYAARA